MLTILFAVLFCLLIPASIYSLWTQFSIPVLFSNVVAFVAIARSLLDAISRDNLRVYFFLQRLRIWWHSDLVTRWWFAVRFDGLNYSPEVIDRIITFLKDKSKFKFDVEVNYRNQREVQSRDR